MATTTPDPIPDPEGAAKTLSGRRAQFPESAGYSLFISLMAFVAGFLGSVWTEDIKNSSPLNGKWSGYNLPQDINRHAAIFWGLTIVWGFLFWLRERFKSKRQKIVNDQTAKFEAQASELIDGNKQLAAASAAIQTAVETLPNEQFREALAKQMSVAQALLDDSFRRESDVEPEDIAAIARYLIGAVANLANLYDLKLETQYGGQLMLYLPRDHVAKIMDEISQGVRFAPARCKENPAEIEGFLWLEKELTATDSLDSHKDPAAQAITLVLPNKDEVAGEWGILPGAPLAFRDGQRDPDAISFRGIDDLRNVAAGGYKLEAGILSEVSAYYGDRGDGHLVRSTLAIPLTRRRITTEGGTVKSVFAVLNIWSGAPNMLGGSDRRRAIFAAVVVPLVNEIAWLGDVWTQKKGLAYP
jgi:hypothetical protein